VRNGKFTYLTETDGNATNQMDFNLFHIQHNRVVTLVRGKSNNYLQLRTIDDLKVVDEFPLHVNFTVYEYKLIGNTEWGLSFGLALKNKVNQNYYNDTILKMFKINEDKIVDLNLSTQANFSNLEATDKYVVSFDNRFPSTIRVIHYSNLSSAFALSGMDASAAKF
jgi:hypothetical protein